MIAAILAVIPGWLKWAVIGLSGACLLSLGSYVLGKHEGRQAATAEALQRSMDLIRQRNDTNAKINNLDDAHLCAAIGGRWVSDAGCE